MNDAWRRLWLLDPRNLLRLARQPALQSLPGISPSIHAAPFQIHMYGITQTDGCFEMKIKNGFSVFFQHCNSRNLYQAPDTHDQSRSAGRTLWTL